MIRLYTFLIFVAIGIVLLYVFFMMPKSDFVGETSLLIVFQNTETASNADNVVNDIVFIANDAVNNNVDVRSNDVHVNVQRLAEHDIVQILVQADSMKDVQFFQKNVLKSIVLNIEKYYTINTDLSIKVIKTEKIQKTTIANIAPYVLMFSVTIGLIAGVLALFYMIDLVREQNEYDKNIDGEKIFAGYHSDKHTDDGNLEDLEMKDVTDDIEVVTKDDLDEKKDVMVDEELPIQDDEKENKNIVTAVSSPETSSDDISISEKAPTIPKNLPVVGVSDFGIDDSSNISEKDVVEADNSDAEPTEEELKARLNELLNGKI